MRTLFDVPVRVVTKRPVVVLVAIGLLSVALAGFASQSQTVEGDAATVDSPEVDAQQLLNSRFRDEEAVLQLVVRTVGRTYAAPTGRGPARQSRCDQGQPAADRLSEQGRRPAILGLLAGAEAAADAQGVTRGERALVGLPRGIAGENLRTNLTN